MNDSSASAAPRFAPSARVLFALGLSLAAAAPAFAQREVRHLNAVSLTAGRTSTGTPAGTYFGPTYYQATYGRFVSDRLRFEVAAMLEQSRSPQTSGDESAARFRGYELGFGIAPTITRLGEVFYLRLPMQLRTRYERQPVSGEILRDGFSVGGSLGLAAEIYLHDRVSLTGEARMAWLPLGHPLEKRPYSLGAGLSFYVGQ